MTSARDSKRGAGPGETYWRAAQADSYCGIDRIHLQDQAITESMAPVTDHGFEHLSPGDEMITRTRKRPVRAVGTPYRDGATPPGQTHPETFLGARGGDFLANEAAGWREAYAARIAGSSDPTGRPRQAAE